MVSGRETTRDTYLETGDPTAACPACWAIGNKRIEIVYYEEKIFCTSLLQPRQNKNLLYRHDKPNERTKKDPFHMSSLSPQSPQFQQSARATPLYSLS